MARILIAEDDQLISRMYQKIFEIEHFEVVVAENGQEALDKTRATKPRVILLDVMMPIMNGLETLQKLKADPETKNIPVIMLTNLAGDKDSEVALANGAVKYIVKSQYSPRQIATMVEEILKGYTRNDIPDPASSK